MSENQPNPVVQQEPVTPLSSPSTETVIPTKQDTPAQGIAAVPEKDQTQQQVEDPGKEVNSEAVNPLDDPAEKEQASDFDITPEKLKFPDYVRVDTEAANDFSSFVKAHKLSVDQVNGIIDWYGKYAEKQAGEARSAEASHIKMYNDAIAAISQEDLQYARQAVEKFSSTAEDKAYIKKSFVSPAVLKVLAAAGRSTAEHPYIQSQNKIPANEAFAGMYSTSIKQGG